MMRYAIIPFLIVLASLEIANATHLRAGEILIEQENCYTYTYKITVILYVNLGSPVLAGGDEAIISFGDGSRVKVPEQDPITLDAKLHRVC